MTPDELVALLHTTEPLIGVERKAIADYIAAQQAEIEELEKAHQVIEAHKCPSCNAQRVSHIALSQSAKQGGG